MNIESATNHKKRTAWMLWHPYQGLWNNELLQKIKDLTPLVPIYSLMARMIIILDTIILILKAFLRRVSQLGLMHIFTHVKVPAHVSVLYFDLGTHKEGNELGWMVERVLPQLSENFEAYGFEASQEAFEQVSARFISKTNVKIINMALCHNIPNNGKIKLYKDSHGGLEDSLYRQTSSYEEVDATRFSDWLLANNIILNRSICLLRMNIEGAEFEVINDLIEQKLSKYIDGYYGMWDDVYKIDNQRGFDFLAILNKHQIYPFTFNGRDFMKRNRLSCIEYDINTSIQSAIRKLKIYNQ